MNEISKDKYVQTSNKVSMISNEIINKNISSKIKKVYVPHPIINNFDTIKWLRRRITKKSIERSVNTLLPKDGEPILEETKDSKEVRKRRFDVWFSSFLKPNDKFSNIKINPILLFSKITMNKVQKLKDIFLEFDGDNSRKLEIDEIVEMFNKNSIEVVESELIKLFFKDKKIPRGEDPYLDFYQFMEFALSKEADQHYRNFMREVKIRLVKKREEELIKKMESIRNKYKSNLGLDEVEKRSLIIENNKKDEDEVIEEYGNIFLPMNFNLVLDYFSNKGKDRLLLNEIQKAIDLIDKYMEGDKKQNEKIESYNENKLTNKPEDDDEEDKKKIMEIYSHEKDEINIKEIVKMFTELIKPKHSADNSKNLIKNRPIEINPKKKSKDAENKINKEYKAEPILQKINIENLKPIILKNKIKIVESQIKTNSTNENDIELKEENENQEISNKLFPMPNKNYFTNFIKEKINAEKVISLEKNFYTKYKSLILATEMTKDEVDSKFTYENLISENCRNKNNLIFNNTKSTKINSDREREREKTIKTFTNSKLNGLKTVYYWSKHNEKLPDIRNKMDFRFRETVNFCKNEPKSLSHRFLSIDIERNKIFSKNFSSSKPISNRNESIPKNILDSINISANTKQNGNNSKIYIFDSSKKNLMNDSILKNTFYSK